MNRLDFSFEETPVEAWLGAVAPGSSVSGSHFLTLVEGEEESCVEEILATLEERDAILDISDLPRPTGSGEAALRLRQEVQLVKKGLRPADLEETDPLRLYLEEIAMTPAAGDERLLAEKAASGDKGAMVMLTNLGLSRVIAIAKEYVGCGVLLLDLIQEGSMGLWQAIQSYTDGDYACQAERRIRFNMARVILLQARACGVGQKMRAALEDYRAVDEQLLAELGRNPTMEEMAEGLHLSVEATATVKKMLDNARILAQAKKEPEPEEEEIAETQAVEDTAYFQMRQRIQDLLAGLSETDAKLLALRYGLEGGLPLSPEEAGRKLGLTPDEVVAREAAALMKLRKNG